MREIKPHLRKDKMDRVILALSKSVTPRCAEASAVNRDGAHI